MRFRLRHECFNGQGFFIDDLLMTAKRAAQRTSKASSFSLEASSLLTGMQ